MKIYISNYIKRHKSRVRHEVYNDLSFHYVCILIA